jgi:golgi phosphoprotein 3
MTDTRNKKLSLHEEILLLALRDDKGSEEWGAGYYVYTLAGAILSELLLSARIVIEESKKHFVEISSEKSTGDPVLDAALLLIGTAKKKKTLEGWLSKIAGTKKLKHQIAEGLCEKGILREEEARILGLFKTMRYPELDPEPEKELIARLDAAIFSQIATVDVRTAIIISLGYRSELLNIPFKAKELRKKKERIEQIINGDLIGKATGDVIKAIQVAVMVATMVPIMTATTVST